MRVPKGLSQVILSSLVKIVLNNKVRTFIIIDTCVQIRWRKDSVFDLSKKIGQYCGHFYFLEKVAEQVEIKFLSKEN
jgi:hypothetical protein